MVVWSCEAQPWRSEASASSSLQQHHNNEENEMKKLRTVQHSTEIINFGKKYPPIYLLKLYFGLFETFLNTLSTQWQWKIWFFSIPQFDFSIYLKFKQIFYLVATETIENWADLELVSVDGWRNLESRYKDIFIFNCDTATCTTLLRLNITDPGTSVLNAKTVIIIYKISTLRYF